MIKNLVVGYALLNQAANDIKALSPESDRIQNTARLEGRAVVQFVPGQVNNDDYQLGPGINLFRALGDFYGNWSTPMANAMDGLNKLGSYFKQVAEAFAEADASQAGSLNASAAISKYMLNPTQSSGSYGLAGTDAVTTYTTNGKRVTSETTTVNASGLTYSETTTFGPVLGKGPNGPIQDTTQVITNPDGSTDTVTTTVNASGAGTRTDTNSATGQTTTYTNAGGDAPWVDITPPSTSGSGDNSPPVYTGPK